MRALAALAALAVLACEAPDPAPDAWPELAVLALPIGTLAPDTYLVTRGHIGYDCAPDVPEPERRCPLDITALRWDPASDHYTASRTAPNVPSPFPFSDHVMWELPLIAPTDGEVIGCWRGMPDDDGDGDDVNCPGGPGLCAQGGNHLNILTDDGHVLSLAHLRRHSIPRELCPIDDTYLVAGDGKTCTLGDGWRGLRDSSRLDRRGLAPIRVRTGDYLGSVGASGSGEGIHFHMHVTTYAHDGENPCTGPQLPIAFTGARVQRRHVGVAPDPGAWQRLDRAVLPIDGSSLLLAP